LTYLDIANSLSSKPPPVSQEAPNAEDVGEHLNEAPYGLL